jgi:2-isopropylmalate synthase
MTAATDRVLIFDTTLRDGEQSPGASGNRSTRAYVHALNKLLVKREKHAPAAIPA